MSARFATLLCLFALGGCASRAPASQATVPAPAPDPLPADAPRVSLRLAPTGAELRLAGTERCLTLAPEERAETLEVGTGEAIELCPGTPGTMAIERLGATTFAGGWVLPTSALPAIPAAEVAVEVDDELVRLGEPEQPMAYLFPGPHSRSLGSLGFVHQPPGSDAAAAASAELRWERFEAARARIESALGPSRSRILILDGSQSIHAGPVVTVAPGADPTPALLAAWLEGPEWWTHGAAAHLALVLGRASDTVSEPDAWDALMTRYERQRRSPGESAAIAQGRVAEDVGALVSFCLAAALARTERSLLGAVRTAATPEGVLAQLAHDEPELVERHRRRVAFRGVVELDSCLELAGSRLVAHQVPVVDPARLVGVGALDETSAVVAAGGGPLREGDVIRHVRGLAVRHAWDIVFHLRDLEGRHRFSVSVERGDRTVRAWLRMVSLGDGLPTTIRFTAEPDEELEGDANPFAERVVQRAVSRSAPREERR